MNMTIKLMMTLLLLRMLTNGQTILQPCKIVDSGGGLSMSTGFMLRTSVGQPGIGSMVGTGFAIEGGYLGCVHEHGPVQSFTIIASADTNGAISPSGSVPIEEGADQNFVISANAGYHVSDVQVDNVSLGPLAEYLFTEVTENHVIHATFSANPGLIAGTISVAGNGLSGVVVKLLDDSSNVVDDFLPDTTDSQGHYAFSDVPSNESYQLLLVEPLGYSVDSNPKGILVGPDDSVTVDFSLSEAVVVNDARGLGYWRHQFDVYVLGKGNAQETDQQLIEYIGGVHEHYTIHFSFFEGLTSFEEWQDLLKYPKSGTALDKATSQLAALVLNLVSLKIGQYTVISADERTVGDALTYVSELIADGAPSNDGLAKDVAEQISNHEIVAAGVVPEGGILYKGGRSIDWTFDLPKQFALIQNFPNPFNPATTIRYDLPVDADVTLEVFTILGQRVLVLVDEHQAPGHYSRTLNGASLASGIYLYRMRAGKFIEVRKMVLLK